MRGYSAFRFSGYKLPRISAHLKSLRSCISPELLSARLRYLCNWHIKVTSPPAEEPQTQTEKDNTRTDLHWKGQIKQKQDFDFWGTLCLEFRVECQHACLEKQEQISINSYSNETKMRWSQVKILRLKYFDISKETLITHKKFERTLISNCSKIFPSPGKPVVDARYYILCPPREGLILSLTSHLIFSC